MHLFVSKDKKQRDAYLNDFYKTHAIDTFDITVLTLENSVKQNTASIGIEDIKQMQKKIFLKPIKSKTKAVVLEDAQLLTPEAQNALLKVLEEPPLHTLLILSTDSKETLLPTIISRCQVIQLEEERPKLSEKEQTELAAFIDDLPTLGIGERLKKAEQLAKDKEKAIAWTEKVILVLRDKLISSHSQRSEESYYLSLIKSFQDLYVMLKTTNVNPRFAIENVLVNI